MSNAIHIVCLDAPSPPDYGGAIDMYYKIMALAETGKQITLHYFNYRKERSAAGLEKFCTHIYSYNRQTGIKGLSFNKPYIVSSRIHKKLIDRLNEDNYPILLEGIHCAGIIPYLHKNRKVVIRMHNDEAEYYKRLAGTETSLFKKLYFLTESFLLKKYQKNVNNQLPFACVSETDIKVLKEVYGQTNLHLIPSFTPWQQFEILEGKGNYCLYNGNMEVSENEKAALWLIQNVFAKISIPFIVAGKNISGELKKSAADYIHISFKSNPTNEEMDALIKNAQINILPSLNNTGLKLKMLHALFYGRYCITNNAGVAGTPIGQAVFIANEPAEYIRAINQLFELPFSVDVIEKRKSIMRLYSNKINLQKLNALL